MAVQTEDELTAGTLDGMDARQSGPQAPGAPVANGSHSIHADPRFRVFRRSTCRAW